MNPDSKPHLITKTLIPENQETPIHFIKDDLIKNNLFYRRNHFPIPTFTSSFYLVPIQGLVQTPRTFSLQEIYSLSSTSLKTVLECSGNKRAFFEPKVFGDQWKEGAISQGVWKGVSLRTLFQYTGLKPTAKEVVFEGHDVGKRPDSDETFSFARSLPLEVALHPDTILAYEYNHQAIPFKHGFPLRLIVPGWYGMASVKWVKKITVIDHEFNGPFQTVDYVYYPNKENDQGKTPVTKVHVNSTIQYPLNRQILHKGVYEVSGIAWTGGEGLVTRVEISLDGGQSWDNCQLNNNPEKYAWVRWNYEWKALENGEFMIKTKAYDSLGNKQPAEAFWNRKGYGYNAVDCIEVKIE